MFKKIVAVGVGVMGSVMASNAFAAFTLPEMPITNLETAGTAVAALVATYVLIRLAIKMIKGA